MNIQPGQLVRIINRDGCGEFFLEGKAMIVDLLPNFKRNRRAMVAPSEEGLGGFSEITVERYIDAGAQGTDEQCSTYIAQMNEEFPF